MGVRGVKLGVNLVACSDKDPCGDSLPRDTLGWVPILNPVCSSHTLTHNGCELGAVIVGCYTDAVCVVEAYLDNCLARVVWVAWCAQTGRLVCRSASGERLISVVPITTVAGVISGVLYCHGRLAGLSCIAAIAHHRSRIPWVHHCSVMVRGLTSAGRGVNGGILWGLSNRRHMLNRCNDLVPGVSNT